MGSLPVVLLSAHVLAGLFAPGDVWRSLLIGLVYLAAAAAGAWTFRRVQERAFRTVVLTLLLALSVVGLLH